MAQVNNIQLTDDAKKLFDVLQNSTPGEWLSRKEIAETLGYPRLNLDKVALLDMLVVNDLVETKREEMPGAIGFSMLYRLKQSA